MRKLFVVLSLVAMLFVGLVPSVLADEKPSQVPNMVDPGDAAFAATFGTANFADLWYDLEGMGAELPATDDWASQGPVGPVNGLFGILPTTTYQHGLPIGFVFHYMQGPPQLAPGWPPAFITNLLAGLGISIIPMPWDIGFDWPAFLTDMGYDEAFVSANGFITFAPPVEDDLGGLGLGNFYPTALPSRDLPNNFVAPYWTDWVIGSNDYQKVEDVCGVNCEDWTCRDTVCNRWDPVTGACLAYDEKCYCEEYDYYEPCAWSWVSRPRGRILVATVGEEPFRRFVVQWSNARHYDTGFLADFELQLYETSNAVLFLYNAFDSKEGPYFEGSPVLVGLEDFYGTTGVGMTFINPWSGATLPAALGGIWPRLPAAFAAGDMVGFVY